MKRLLVIVSFIAVIGLGVWFGLRAPEREAAPRPDVTTVTLSPPPAAQSQPLVLPSFLDLPIDALETGDQDEPSMPVDAPVETFVRAEELSGPQVRQEAKADSEMGGDQGLLLRNRYNQLKSGDVVVADTAPNDRDLGPGAGKERLGHRAQPPADDGLTGEAYAARADNPFMRVSEPGGDASTFAIDVDTASYSNVRRYLTQNRQRPPAAAVRIEEMINYFDYDYPAPTARDAHPFRFATAVAACPWAESHRLVRVALQGRVLDRSTRPALNLVFLVDTSGSMRGANRLPLVLRGLELLVEQLDERDHVAIVTYAGSAGTALAATSGADQARIRAVIRGLTAGGSTNGGGGINAAYDQAALHAGAGVQSRVVLCTDGDFNVGVTSQDQLKHLIEAKRASGVFLSVYGFGMGNLKDQTLEMLANTGNGVYGYIDDERELRKVMVDESLGALVTIAKDV